MATRQSSAKVGRLNAASGAAAAYPAEREADVALRDGSTVHVRPIRAEDEGALFEFLEALDPSSRMFRFFSLGVDLNAAARSMADVDYAGRYGLVALREGEIVGQGIYIAGARQATRRSPSPSPTGCRAWASATLLLAHLAQVAAEQRHLDLPRPR